MGIALEFPTIRYAGLNTSFLFEDAKGSYNKRYVLPDSRTNILTFPEADASKKLLMIEPPIRAMFGNAGETLGFRMNSRVR